MAKLRFFINRKRASRALVLTFGIGILLSVHPVSMGFASLVYAQQGDRPIPAAGTAPQASRLPPEFQDLGMKIKEPFTFAGVGDIIIRHPMAQLADPNFQNLVQHLRDADVAFANMEGTLLDFDNFPNPIGGGAPKGALLDIKAMGIRVMSTANNHSWDGSAAGLFETIKNLDEASIVHAGTGRNLQEARSAAFFNGSKGSVGLVSMWSIDPTSEPTPIVAASYRNGDQGGAPGMNPLHVTPHYVVTAEQMDALRKIRDSVYARRIEVPSTSLAIPPVPADEPKDQLELFGIWYKVGPKAGDISYTMDPQDEREILRSIRNGKENSDFMVASIHCHQANYAFQEYSLDNDVPDFLVDLAHKAIDNGADVFIGEGVHTLRGVEIYKGKPIFYGIASFVSQGLYGIRSEPANPSNGTLTDIESGWRGQRYHPDELEVLLVTAHYEGGKLVDVHLYPADLGQEMKRPLSRLGIPMIPSPELAQKILEKVQRISKQFGTTISIENNVGVIRVGATGVSESRADRGGAR
jgi:poly-gamma-glutamate capsule biosynthesis protein CapA/YwtB (metallophosphatase superfamily)